MPDTCKIWGEPIAPEDIIISLFTFTFLSSSPCQNSTSLAVLLSKFIFLIWALVTIFKFFLYLIGFKYPTEVLHLNPSFWVTWKYPQPWLSPVLKSFVLGVAGAAGDHYVLLIFGLALSIILMATAATVISRWINEYKWIAWIGIIAILVVAIELIYTDLKLFI